jgi:hypothetical protein
MCEANTAPWMPSGQPAGGSPELGEQSSPVAPVAGLVLGAGVPDVPPVVSRRIVAAGSAECSTSSMSCCLLPLTGEPEFPGKVPVC